MTSVLLIIHIILALCIIGLVLLQRGSGGGLGLGDGGGMGGLASPRSAANILTKLTTWCAILFFATSLGLAIVASRGNQSTVEDELTATPAATEQTDVAPEVPAAPGAIATDEPSPADPKPPTAPVVPEAPATP